MTAYRRNVGDGLVALFRGRRFNRGATWGLMIIGALSVLSLALRYPDRRPFFLFLHFDDPHLPYTQPERWVPRETLATLERLGLALPFPEASFDLVLCQFGVMFFSDKPQAFSEARRVLKSGGVFMFNVWDRIAENEFADTVTTALASFFPNDPPRFMARTPHGYHDRRVIERDLAHGGFRGSPRIDTVAARSRATAIATCCTKIPDSGTGGSRSRRSECGRTGRRSAPASGSMASSTVGRSHGC